MKIKKKYKKNHKKAKRKTDDERAKKKEEIYTVKVLNETHEKGAPANFPIVLVTFSINLLSISLKSRPLRFSPVILRV